MISDKIIGIAFGYESIALVTRWFPPITKIAVKHPALAGLTAGVLGWHLHDYYARNHTH